MYLKMALFIPAFHLKINLQIKVIKMALYSSALISRQTFETPRLPAISSYIPSSGGIHGGEYSNTKLYGLVFSPEG